MKEIYDKLNYYLNEICKYLEKENAFLLENIYAISRLNDEVLKHIEDYRLDNKTKQNKLTFEDVFLLARKIIASIDKSYLESFDNLIKSGELDFSFESAYEDSVCISMHRKNQVKQIININREFNYNDVRLLVHEFIHYTNGKHISPNRHYFTEFLSIYFEFYTIDYLLKKGINKDEIDSMVDEVYRNVEANDGVKINVTLNNDVRGEEKSDNKEEENRQIRRKNNMLNDLIRILILRELIGKPGCFGYNCQRPGMPPHPQPRPPFPRYDFNM